MATAKNSGGGSANRAADGNSAAEGPAARTDGESAANQTDGESDIANVDTVHNEQNIQHAKAFYELPKSSDRPFFDGCNMKLILSGISCFAILLGHVVWVLCDESWQDLC